MKQPNKINPGDPRRPICPRRVAEDANGWADRLRAERSARAPAVPAPVVVNGAAS